MTYLLLKTNDAVCEFAIYKDGKLNSYKWEAGRTLAKDIFSYLENILKKNNSNFSDLSGIGVFEGPGSFTGLRIGITVANTLSDGLNIPIVGVRSDDWCTDAINMLKNGCNQKIVLPFYGAEANITVSKK